MAITNVGDLVTTMGHWVDLLRARVVYVTQHTSVSTEKDHLKDLKLSKKAVGYVVICYPSIDRCMTCVAFRPAEGKLPFSYHVKPHFQCKGLYLLSLTSDS